MSGYRRRPGSGFATVTRTAGFARQGTTRTALIRSRAQCGVAAVMVTDGAEDGGNTLLRGVGIDDVAGIKHGDDGDSAGTVKASPLAADEGVLNVVPVAKVERGGGGCFEGGGRRGADGIQKGWSRRRGIRRRRRDGDGIVDEAEELIELAEVDAHLVNELSDGHLLRGGETVKIAAVRARVFNGLNRGDAQEGAGVLVGDLGRERGDTAAMAADRAPQRRIGMEVVEDLLETRGIKSRSLPELGGRRLDKRVGIEGIGLGVRALRQIEAEAGADKGASGSGIGIGGQNPAFMTAVAQQVHQIGKIELHAGGAKGEQRGDGGRESRTG